MKYLRLIGGLLFVRRKIVLVLTVVVGVVLSCINSSKDFIDVASLFLSGLVWLL